MEDTRTHYTKTSAMSEACECGNRRFDGACWARKRETNHRVNEEKGIRPKKVTWRCVSLILLSHFTRAI